MFFLFSHSIFYSFYLITYNQQFPWLSPLNSEPEGKDYSTSLCASALHTKADNTGACAHTHRAGTFSLMCYLKLVSLYYSFSLFTIWKIYILGYISSSDMSLIFPRHKHYFLHSRPEKFLTLHTKIKIICVFFTILPSLHITRLPYILALQLYNILCFPPNPTNLDDNWLLFCSYTLFNIISRQFCYPVFSILDWLSSCQLCSFFLQLSSQSLC